MNKWMAYILGVAMFQCMRTASWSFNSYRKWMKSSQHNTHTEPRTTKKSQSMFWIHTLRWLQFRQKKKPTSRLANSTWNRIIASQRERERIYAANAHAKWNIPHIVALLYHVNASIFFVAFSVCAAQKSIQFSFCSATAGTQLERVQRK